MLLQTLSQRIFFMKCKHTMVPYFRIAMEVGADSMANEIGTHLKATCMGYLTVDTQQDISHHKYNGRGMLLCMNAVSRHVTSHTGW